jgi:hypothetical protein
MKKTSIVFAILVSAALAGCHKKAANTTPTNTGTTEGSAMGSDMGSGDMGSAAPTEGGMGSDATGGEGGGSAM